MLPPSSCGKSGLGDPASPPSLPLDPPTSSPPVCFCPSQSRGFPKSSPWWWWWSGVGVGGRAPPRSLNLPAPGLLAGSASSCLSLQGHRPAGLSRMRVQEGLAHPWASQCGVPSRQRPWGQRGPVLLSVGAEVDKAHVRAAGLLHANPRSPENRRDAEVTMETQKWQRFVLLGPNGPCLRTACPCPRGTGAGGPGWLRGEFQDLTL